MCGQCGTCIMGKGVGPPCDLQLRWYGPIGAKEKVIPAGGFSGWRMLPRG
jgi:hypothetical protein